MAELRAQLRVATSTAARAIDDTAKLRLDTQTRFVAKADFERHSDRLDSRLDDMMDEIRKLADQRTRPRG